MTELLEKAIASVRQLTESEQDGIAAMILQELEKKQVVAWDDFDQIMQESQVSTGISDLSHQHDHYIHGIPTRPDFES
jgi:ssDNA-specific exonuclease RecJ